VQNKYKIGAPIDSNWCTDKVECVQENYIALIKGSDRSDRSRPSSPLMRALLLEGESDDHVGTIDRMAGEGEGGAGLGLAIDDWSGIVETTGTADADSGW